MNKLNHSSTTSTCPYASKLILKEQNTQDDETLQALEIAKNKCPAFQSKSSTASCPFRSVNNSEEFKKAMLRIPPSHFVEDDKSGDIPKQFRLALEHMHEISQSLQGTLLGGCPFKSYYQDSNESNVVPFIAAMENFSLSAIMADIIAEERRDSLSTALKQGTAASHKAAENVHFVRDFIKQQIPLHLYKQMLIGLYFTYEALEEQLDKYGPVHFPLLYQPHKLARTMSLKRDLLYFFDDLEKLKPSAAVQDYINRIYSVEPMLLLSHAYTRYLGDLSGGRVLARVAKKALNLPDEALNFYKFENIPNPKEFKDYYRYQLDQLSLSNNLITAMVQEANVAFVLNMRVFEELDVFGGVSGAVVRPLEEALSFRAEVGDTSKQCPFAAMAKETKQCPAKSNQCPAKSKQSPNKEKRCPWPFVFMHDPQQGMKDYQTWIVLGLFFCYFYKFVKSYF